MSVYLPFEIQVEILKCLPVKSLIQFRSVSKAWRSLIDSSAFIASHDVRHTQPQHLFVKYRDPSGTENKYVSFVDDVTFPQQMFAQTVPGTIKLLHNTLVVGSSHGLLCCFGYFTSDSHGLTMGFCVLWNPSIRKWSLIGVPYFYKERDDQISLGFGVCPDTMEPKIVMIRRLSVWCDKVETDWDLKVYALNSREWRNLSSNLPRNSITVLWNQVVIDRFIYWLALDAPVDAPQNLILSFDMIDEVFGVIELPTNLREMFLSISKIRESLILVDHRDEFARCVLWVMMKGDGVQISFKKLLIIKSPLDSMRTLGFSENAEVLMETAEKNLDSCWIVSYEPISGHIIGLGICADLGSFDVHPYVETLLLLDQSDSY